jgi:hypothetical protein
MFIFKAGIDFVLGSSLSPFTRESIPGRNCLSQGTVSVESMPGWGPQSLKILALLTRIMLRGERSPATNADTGKGEMCCVIKYK